MALEILIDGNLLAECERSGNIRFGMLRVSEEITKKLFNYNELKLSFANTSDIYTNYEPLRSFIKKQKKVAYSKVISPYPFPFGRLGTVRTLYGKVARKLKWDNTFHDVNEYNLFHSFFHPFPDKVSNAHIKKSITFLDIIPLRMSGYPQSSVDITRKIITSIIPNYAIAISEYSKQDLCDYEKEINPEQVFVVPLAADRDLFYVNKNKEDWLHVKKRYQLPENYFLCISSTDQRKNLLHTIKSFDKFIQQQKTSDLYLVLTGNSVLNHAVLNKMPIQDQTKKRIIIPEPIMERDLSVVYSNALGFLFLSLYEGFGLPVLEAMQCGVPVISSNTTSLPEVMGNAGIMIPPSDVDALCDAMLKLYGDEELRKAYIELGLKQASRFSWERCGEEYRNIFKKICG